MTIQWFVFLFSVNLAPLTFSSLEPLLAFETACRPSRPFLRQFGASDVFIPGSPACTWNCIAHLSSFSPSIWCPWRFLPWSPCLHLKLHGTLSSFFSVNLAPLMFSSLEPLFALKTAWPLSSFSPSIWRPDVFFPGSPTYIWNCMAPLSSFSPSIWRPWRFFPWSPYFLVKLHGASLVLFLRQFGAPMFSSLEPLLALETAWRPSRPFLRQFGAPDVFFPEAPTFIWNYMAPLSSFSPSIWRPWRFLPWSPCLHLKLHGASLVLFSVNLAPLTFSSLEPLLALETAWRPSRPFLRQFGAPDFFFPGTPTFIWNCMAPPLVLFSVNFAPLTFSSLEPLLALETAWRISRPFLRQFGTPDVFFSGAPACSWNCMTPLSTFFPSIRRPWLFLPWNPYFHLKLHGTPSRPFLRQFCAPDVFFPGACTWNCMAPLSSYWFNFLSFFFLSCSLFLPFLLSYSLLFLFFPLFSPLSFFSFLFYLSFWRPFGDPGRPGPPKPPQDTPLLSLWQCNTICLQLSHAFVYCHEASFETPCLMSFSNISSNNISFWSVKKEIFDMKNFLLIPYLPKKYNVIVEKKIE